MEFSKKQSSYTVLAVVRASKHINWNHVTKKSYKNIRKINRKLLPIAVEYYSKILSKYHQRKQQATSLCPFHNERNPSFSVNLKTGAFICFACGVSGGSIIDFHMKLYGKTFIDACKELGVCHD